MTAPETLDLFVFHRTDLGGERLRSIGSDQASKRIFLVEKQRGSAVKVMASLTLDQGIGLAEAVIAGNPQAINRPKAMLELAAFTLALWAATTRPELFLDQGDDNGRETV